MKPRFNNLTVFLTLMALALIAYFPSIGGGFLLYDDPDYITENFHLTDFSLNGFINLFNLQGYDLYIPLTWVSYWVEKNVFHFSAIGMHISNILFHGINAFLLFILFVKLFHKMRPAFLLALLFLLHPQHVESVAWLAERKDVLYTFFYLLAFIFYIDFKNTGNKTYYYTAFLCFVLSCLAKPMAVSLPVLLILMDYFVFDERKVKQQLNKIPFLFVSLLFSIVAVRMMDTGSLPDEVLHYSVLTKIMIPFYELGFYIVKLILPVNLCAIYALPGLPEIYLYALFFIVLAAFAWLKGNNYIRFAVLAYVVILLPVLQLIPNANALVVDRYAYVSSIALFTVICFWIDKNNLLQKSINVIFALVILAFGFMSYNRCKVWTSDLALFTDVISKNKKSQTAYANLGMYYLNHNNAGQALVNLQEAATLQSDNTVILTNYAWALAINNQADKSLQVLLRSADITPLYFKTWNNLGVVLGIKGRYQLSLKSLLMAGKLNSHNAELYYNMAITYTNLHQNDHAISCYQRAAKMGLTQAQQFLSANNLGW